MVKIYLEFSDDTSLKLVWRKETVTYYIGQS